MELLWAHSAFLLLLLNMFISIGVEAYVIYWSLNLSIYLFIFGYSFSKDIATGKSILFAPRLPPDYAVWLGKIKPLSYFQVTTMSVMVDLLGRIVMNIHCLYFYLQFYFPLLQEKYMVNMVYYTDEIVGVLQGHYKGPGKPLLFLLHGLNTDSNNFSKPAQFEVLVSFFYYLPVFFIYALQKDWWLSS